jgi:CDP-diacylglycerol--serine O-phosphatidyltransferase
MVLTPAILAIALDAKGKLPELQAVLQHPILGGAMLLFVGSLMASRLPTISLKALHFTSKRQMRIFMAIALLLIALLVSNLWLTLGIIGMLYIFTIPVTCKIFIKEKNKYLARTQDES